MEFVRLKDVYGVNYLFEYSIWPIIHLLNPFNIYIITRSLWITIIMFFVWESIEVFNLTVCGGNFCLWGKEPYDLAGAEGGGSGSLLGDIGQGFIGVYLARLFCATFNPPIWMLNLFESKKRAVLNLWFKRLFMILVLLPATYISTINVAGWRTGPIFYALAYIIIFVIFGFWNHTKREQREFWTDSQQRANYIRIYAIWLLIDIMLILSFYYPFNSMYANVWVQTLIIFGLLSVSCLFNGLEYPYINWLTCGLFDLCRLKTNPKQETV